MENRKKLLTKSLNVLVVYTAIVLIASIPAYYAITDYIWQTELNEHNYIISESVKQNLKQLVQGDEEFATGQELNEALKIWNKMQPEMKLLKVAKLKPDSVYNTQRKSRFSQDINRFQGLITYVELSGQPYSLTIESNIEESHETILAFTTVTMAFLAILLAGFVLLNRIISQKIWKPFYKSLEKIKSFNLNNQQALVFDSTNIEEFHALNASIEKLIAGNLVSYQQQKEFTENASHELQTPLAIIQHKLDLLLQNQKLTGKEAEHIDQIQKALSRASRTIKNLLLLSKIENLQFTEIELVNLSELITINIELLVELATEKQLELSQSIQSGIFVHGNRILIDVLITNLLLNAIRHSSPDGKIKIELSENSLQISNTGSLALNSENLFKRFGKASEVNQGTGLGLSLVKQISIQHGWKISYNFYDALHIFKIEYEKQG